MRYKVAPDYSIEYLEVERPSPLSDKHIENIIQDILHGKWDNDISDDIYTNFKSEATDWIFNSKLNNYSGIETFNRIDIINGCTQFIDNIYMRGPVQSLYGDYRYHERLNNPYCNRNVCDLIPNIPLIIALPSPSTGDKHVSMDQILDECLDKNIIVHIDGAWITCCRDISFDFNHPVIKSVGISLSKGLGLGWNRIGLRWTRDPKPDSITIMNDFRMNIRVASKIGLHFIRELPTDYLWNSYGSVYYKICKDFNLTPTNSIYIALKDNQPVGLSPLIRYVTE